MDEVDQAKCQDVVSSLRLIQSRALKNAQVFQSSSENDKMFRKSYLLLCRILSTDFIPVVEHLFQVAHKFDAYPGLRANGMRSWLDCVSRLANDINKLSAFIESSHQSVFFLPGKTAGQLKAIVDYMAAVLQCIRVIKTYSEISPNSLVIDRSLDESVSLEKIVDVVSEMRCIDVHALRGRTPCYHFNPAVDHISQGLLITFGAYCQPLKMAATSQNDPDEDFRPNSPDSGRGSCDERSSLETLNSSASFLSLVTNRDALANDVRWGLANLSLGELKSFWTICDSPLFLAGLKIMQPSIALSHAINLFSVPLHVKVQGSGTVTIEPPQSGTGIRPTMTRLLSGVIRRGQEYWKGVSKSSLQPVSDSIVFHVHGGGFICQSSKTQEILCLKEFCHATQVPFFSVDYSLLPDAFPRAVEETLFAYCWMLENMAKLGSSGKKIVCLGDSAGCCLLASLCVDLIRRNIRLPDSMLFVYPYTCASFAPSSSRLLSFADPIVPIPLLLRCCFGYAQLTEQGVRTTLGIKNKNTEHQSSSLSLSPIFSDSLKHSKSAPDLLFRQASMDSIPEPQCESGNLDFVKTPFSPEERREFAEMFTLPVFSNPLFSPIIASDLILAKMPPLKIFASTGDPLLDDSIVFCKRLRNAGAQCNMTILDGVPHGFLGMAVPSSFCRKAFGDVKNTLVDMTKIV